MNEFFRQFLSLSPGAEIVQTRDFFLADYGKILIRNRSVLQGCITSMCCSRRKGKLPLQEKEKILPRNMWRMHLLAACGGRGRRERGDRQWGGGVGWGRGEDS